MTEAADTLWLYHALGERGLIVGSAGNISARVPDGMVITPSGGSPGVLTEAGLARTTLDGAALNEVTPSSEWAMHAGIYQADPAARFIVHTHAELPAFHYMVLQFGGDDVRCAPYVTFGTPELARLAVEALRDRTACLLANHGMIVIGRSRDEAFGRSLLLEQLCRQYLLARAAGTPRLLSVAEMAGARERFRTYGPRPADGASNPA